MISLDLMMTTKDKILIDAISLLSPLTGIGRYTYEISKRLQSNSLFKTNYFYGYYSKNCIEPSSKSQIKNMASIIKKIPLLKKLIRKIIVLKTKLYHPSYDLYWQPNAMPTENIKTNKTVTTVHDFSFMIYAEFHPKERIAHLEKNFMKNIHKSDMIITGSNFSKNEILERLDFEEDQVRVIYHGIDHDLFKVYNTKDLVLDFELPEKFILTVGSIEPRKNLQGLLEAYSQLSQQIKKEYKLVLAGFKGWENKEIMSLIDNDKENIHYLGFVSDTELSMIYNLASLFVFPSYYEGFGLPVLEAMACGTPVVCSDSSSLPEVGGDCVV
ncbi:MAG: glycosyltransferase family 1 protein, partial [Arcobacteraceae bacterium]